jgi:predicted Zn-dependent protease
VIGHEIGHVTARHGVNQMSKQMLAMVSVEVAAVLADVDDGWAGVAALGMGLVFLKHGRDDERQADELGLRYSQRVGFDLRESPQVFDLLDRVSQVEGVGRLPNWLATHPDPGSRRVRVQEKVAALEASGTSFEGTRIGRDAYVERLDGMVFGENPKTVKVVRLQKAMTLEEFARTYPSTVDLATLALINHVAPGARLEADTLVKRVVE